MKKLSLFKKDVKTEEDPVLSKGKHQNYGSDCDNIVQSKDLGKEDSLITGRSGRMQTVPNESKKGSSKTPDEKASETTNLLKSTASKSPCERKVLSPFKRLSKKWKGEKKARRRSKTLPASLQYEDTDFTECIGKSTKNLNISEDSSGKPNRICRAPKDFASSGDEICKNGADVHLPEASTEIRHDRSRSTKEFHHKGLRDEATSVRTNSIELNWMDSNSTSPVISRSFINVSTVGIDKRLRACTLPLKALDITCTDVYAPENNIAWYKTSEDVLVQMYLGHRSRRMAVCEESSEERVAFSELVGSYVQFKRLSDLGLV